MSPRSWGRGGAPVASTVLWALNRWMVPSSRHRAMTPLHAPSLSMSRSRAKYSTKNCGRESRREVSPAHYLFVCWSLRRSKAAEGREGSGRLLVAPPVYCASARPRRACGASRGQCGQPQLRSGTPARPSRSPGSDLRMPAGRSCRRLPSGQVRARVSGNQLPRAVGLGPCGAQTRTIVITGGLPTRTCSGEREAVVLKLDDSLRRLTAHVLQRGAGGTSFSSRFLVCRTTNRARELRPRSRNFRTWIAS